MKPFTDEHKAKISAALMGNQNSASDEAKAKIRAARAKQIVRHSVETREKLSAALKGNVNGRGTKGHTGLRGAANGCFKHGLRHSATYNSWRAMLQRCNDPKNNRFYLYGGRGIRVGAEWLFFENFLSDMGIRPDGMTLDRIDPNGHYEASNCRWATTVQQRNNRRTV